MYVCKYVCICIYTYNHNQNALNPLNAYVQEY